ncbi:MAG: hypothetical protein CUN55_04040 [Phototrophicales bacterium]|nr:MAG: hypothetical protein CUN55_04040 [Phototrophicales bacterium]
MDNTQSSPSPEQAPQGSSFLPLWVIAAFGILALIITAYIFTQIAGPLSEIVLGGDPEIPIPDDVVLEKEEGQSGSASRTYFYTTEKSGCEIASFYYEHGARCTTQPFICNPDGTQNSTESFVTLGSCRYTKDEDVTGYSWEVYIATNYPEGPFTRFRILVYD